MGNNRNVVVITGMHRSGTSLTTSLLQSAGIFVGDRLLGDNLSNPRGHFEDLDFAEFHQSILQSQGVCSEGWIDNTSKEIQPKYLEKARDLIEQRNEHLVWGWKDPRTALFLDFWSELIPDAKYIFIYRSPWEVADSLYRRGDALFQTNPEIAIRTWINYNQKILHFCSRTSQPWILLRIEDVIENPQFIVDAVNQKLSLNLRSPKNLYDDSLFKKSSVNLYQAKLVQKYFFQAFQLYLQLHGCATLIENTTVCLAKKSRTVPWFWQNWLDRPIKKIKTTRYWSKLRHTITQ
ncbi:sulfotransferase [Waterburya agarophytonicola K14]|uniref:Sulfotransferase n=1 Tax=Waterburya agarophytonicola KI4 TaxID=2874699 RepID=A0A964BPV0_9CYAN|nr:sulfotransferase [Waterburya agarophytonicola]MCC0176132.1 sulfotransferase [Waterburya agarophytonicola KI4]